MPRLRLPEVLRQEVRTRLVRVGLDLFARQGFAATTVDQVAAAAGVAKGTVYNYFQSKEDLALAGLGEVLAAFEGGLERVLAARPTLTERLRELFSQLDPWIRVHPDLVWLWAVENLRRGPAEPGAVIFDRIVRCLLQEAQRAGDLRGDRGLAELAAGLEGVLLAAIAGWYHARPAAGSAPDLGRAAATFLEGARRRECRA